MTLHFTCICGSNRFARYKCTKCTYYFNITLHWSLDDRWHPVLGLVNAAKKTIKSVYVYYGVATFWSCSSLIMLFIYRVTGPMWRRWYWIIGYYYYYNLTIVIIIVITISNIKSYSTAVHQPNLNTYYTVYLYSFIMLRILCRLYEHATFQSFP